MTARSVGIVVYPGFHFMSLIAASAFEVANWKLGKTAYDVRIISETGGSVASSLGSEVRTEEFDYATSYDTILVGGGMSIPEATPGLLDFVRHAARTTRRVASLCLGAFVLGDAGLLDDRRATTHWQFAHRFQELFPRCRVDFEKIHVSDGNIWSSAGMTAASDLAVKMIELDHGRELARLVTYGLVMENRRAGGQPQKSFLVDLDARTDRIQAALIYARKNLRSALTIEELAAAASLSPRQFTRLFRAETGITAAKAVENLRVEAAKLLLDQSRLAVGEIAQEVGFASRDRMRRAFLRVYGEIPSAIRSDATPLADL